MNEHSTDRRVRRTKALLLQGLIELMADKDINDISVKELSDWADINRGTFYLHYSDLHDMLAQIEDELFTEFHEILNRTLNTKTGEHSPQTTLYEIFSFLERHRNMAKVMMGPHGDLAFVNRLKNLVNIRLSSVFSAKDGKNVCPYAESFAVSGCIGVIETWLNQASPPAPQDMAAICGNMLIKGVDSPSQAL